MTTERKFLDITFAERCAWRAIYVYVRGNQIARLGIDPTASVPSIFGAFYFVSPRPWRRMRRLQSFLYRFTEFRIPLPIVGFRHPQPKWQRAIYKWQQTLLHKIDGRYGWGTGR